MPRSEPDSRSHDAPRSTDLAGRKAEDDVTELDSRSLLAGLRRRVIVHQGERYCLQLTRAGKLLLTK
jgi:hemin uptake protein HemP